MVERSTDATSLAPQSIQAESLQAQLSSSTPYRVELDPTCQVSTSEPYSVSLDRITESLREIAQYADATDCPSGQLQAASCRAKTLGPYLLYYTVERSERVVRLLKVAGGGSYY